MKYRIELTEEQMRVVSNALEEWFRLRMGQSIDFCDDMAVINFSLSPDSPNREKVFNNMVQRRDHLQEIMGCFFRIAFEPIGYITQKTDDMLVAEDIWDAIRTVRGMNMRGVPLHVSDEPFPIIEKLEGE